MKKANLTKEVKKAKTSTKEALQTIYDALNNGQQKKIQKNEEVKRLLLFYGVTL